jgi:hypothetical protein
VANVSVTIPTAGTWPAADELAARNAIIDALAAAGIGSCTGAGGGRGAMDFSYRVADVEAARAAIASAMQAHMPGAEYQVHVSD